VLLVPSVMVAMVAGLLLPAATMPGGAPVPAGFGVVTNPLEYRFDETATVAW